MDNHRRELLETYAHNRGIRTAETAVYHAVAVDDDQDATRREFISLLAGTDSARARRGIWFGLLTMAHMSVSALHHTSSLSRTHLEMLVLAPAAATLRDTMIKLGKIEDVTAALLQTSTDAQLLDLYDLAVAAVSALFHNLCHTGTLAERWEVFAQLIARKDPAHHLGHTTQAT